MILITPLYVLVHLSTERNVLLILDERSTNMYSKMVPSVTQANQRMCGLAVELRSDSRQEVKYKHQIWLSESDAQGNVFFFFPLCIELNMPIHMQICSNNSLIRKEKLLWNHTGSTFLLLCLHFLSSFAFFPRNYLSFHLCVVYPGDVVFMWPNKTLFCYSLTVKGIIFWLNTTFSVPFVVYWLRLWGNNL